MALTSSRMLALGTEAPGFKLWSPVDEKEHGLDELKSDKATVLMFICNHCPYVKHVQTGLVEIAHDYIPKGVSFIAINSNDVEKYPEDSPSNMKNVAQRLGYPFPYLFDETQDVARSYDAACTPDFYVFDGGLRLVYRGQMDDSRPGNGWPVTGKNIREALYRVLRGEPASADQIPSIGCNIKWK
jgi:thiol-disulfide isomerase/thioredoxin